MKDIEHLLTTIESRLPDANRNHFPGKSIRLRVERTKIEKPIHLEGSFPIIAWHNEVPNDFCIYTNVLDPTAYLYVKRKDDDLTITKAVSDGFDKDPEVGQSELLDLTLDDNEIAQQLIDWVVAASRGARQPLAPSV